MNDTPALIVAKRLVRAKWEESGISKSELARRMGVRETEVRRILDEGHATKIGRLDEAARALGCRISISIELP